MCVYIVCTHACMCVYLCVYVCMHKIVYFVNVYVSKYVFSGHVDVRREHLAPTSFALCIHLFVWFLIFKPWSLFESESHPICLDNWPKNSQILHVNTYAPNPTILELGICAHCWAFELGSSCIHCKYF